jgi:hypothetical protein
MNVNCVDRERIFLDGSTEEWAALEAHAVTCPECGEELRVWKSMSVEAEELKQDWETPYLWSKIERRLSEQMEAKPSRVRAWFDSWGMRRFKWQTAAALALLVVVTVTAIRILRPFGPDPGPGKQVFLKNSAVTKVERAEAEYQKAIDELAAQARPQLDPPATPLMASYREKLVVLDNAIDELREEAGQNPANAHLRRQLLAMYQEKQDTLQEILEAKR